MYSSKEKAKDIIREAYVGWEDDAIQVCKDYVDLLAKQPWISVEIPPKEDREYVVWVDELDVAEWCCGKWNLWDESPLDPFAPLQRRENRITHWMIVEPPK